jgi:hypothetical protein
MSTLEILWYETLVSQRMATSPTADPYPHLATKRPRPGFKPKDIEKQERPEYTRWEG